MGMIGSWRDAKQEKRSSESELQIVRRVDPFEEWPEARRKYRSTVSTLFLQGMFGIVLALIFFQIALIALMLKMEENRISYKTLSPATANEKRYD